MSDVIPDECQMSREAAQQLAASTAAQKTLLIAKGLLVKGGRVPRQGTKGVDLFYGYCKTVAADQKAEVSTKLKTKKDKKYAYVRCLGCDKVSIHIPLIE